MPCHLLFCDYEGEFKYSETLSRVGYVVDHVRPEALRHVNVGDHQVFVFVYSTAENASLARQTADKLRAAELPSEIVLLNMGLNQDTPEEVSGAESITPLLDRLDDLVGTPFPPSLKNSMGTLRTDREKENYRARISELEEKIHQLEEQRRQSAGVSEDMKPKLQALLKGQKLQHQTETERLKIQLSELEAKLIDREAKLKELHKKLGPSLGDE